MKKIYLLSVVAVLVILTFIMCEQVNIEYNPAVSPVVQTSVPVNVSSSSAELKAVGKNGGDNFSKRSFYYTGETVLLSEDLDNDQVRKIIINEGTHVEVGAGEFTVRVNDLEPESTYYYLAFGNNNHGESYGEPVMFQTNSQDDFPVVSIIPVFEEVDDHTAKVSAKVTSIGGTYLDECGFVWSNTPNPTTDDNKIPVDGQQEGTFDVMMPDVEKLVKYYVKAYAINNSGIVYSEELVVLFIDNTFIDQRDGAEYTIKLYGSDIWITENFRYLPEVGNQAGIWVPGYLGADVEEAKATEEYQTYGCLYNLQKAIDLAPEGWHLATDEEWKTLEILSSGGTLTQEAANGTGWRAANASRLKNWDGAANDLKFNLMPGGKQWCGGAFQEVGVWAHYYAAKEGHPYDSFYRRMLAGWDSNIYREDSSVDGYPVCAGMSVRYVHD